MTLNSLGDIENYRKHFMDASFWQLYIAAGMDQVQLPCKLVRGGIPGTFPTFIVDDTYVIKFFGRLFDGENSYLAELNANQFVKDQRNIKIPALVAQGILLEGDFQWSWPFLVFEYLDGISIGEAWEDLSWNGKQEVARELGQMVRSIHSIPLKEGENFYPGKDTFRHFLEAQQLKLFDRMKFTEGLPNYLKDQLEGFLQPIDQLIGQEKEPHLIHADLTRDHLLGKVNDGKWITQGVIDFGDAMVGNIFYELIALHMDLFQGDRHLLRIFLENYGFDTTLKSDFSIRAMNMTLLHQFGENILVDLFRRLPQLSQFNTIVELSEEVWGLDF